MKEIIVTHCKDCPFHYTDVDENTTGFDTIEKCNFGSFLKSKSTITVYDSWSFDGNYKVPEWCPLKVNSIKVENIFKN